MLTGRGLRLLPARRGFAAALHGRPGVRRRAARVEGPSRIGAHSMHNPLEGECGAWYKHEALGRPEMRFAQIEWVLSRWRAPRLLPRSLIASPDADAQGCASGFVPWQKVRATYSQVVGIIRLILDAVVAGCAPCTYTPFSWGSGRTTDRRTAYEWEPSSTDRAADVHRPSDVDQGR